MRIKKIINDTIYNFYKPVKRYYNDNPGDEYGEEAPRGGSFLERMSKSMTAQSANKTGAGANQS